MDDILTLEKRQKNYTKIDFDGIRLDEAEEETVDDMAIANDDVIVVELPFKTNWVFSLAKKEDLGESTNTASTAVS